MIIELTRLQALELQGIMRDALSEQNYLQVLENYDSSNMEIICQINHKLMKLEQSMKGNRFNHMLKKELIEQVNELCLVKQDYVLNDNLLTLIVACCLKEIDKFDALISLDDFSQQYKDNIQKRKLSLISLVQKISNS